MKVLKPDTTNSVPHLELSGWDVYALARILNDGLEGKVADRQTILMFTSKYWNELHSKDSTWQPDYHITNPQKLLSKEELLKQQPES